MTADWYPRFADIPGVTYTTPPEVDRSRIPGVTARPEIGSYKDLDGKKVEYLSWDGEADEDGEPSLTSEAPASQHASSRDPARASDALTLLAEVLELPGEPDDYHFAIQSTIDKIWSRAQEEPALVSRIEELARLDLALAQAAPDAVSHVNDGKRQWYRLTGVGRLLRLYEREGAWHEALELARFAAEHFDQLHDKVTELTERVSVMEAEGT